MPPLLLALALCAPCVVVRPVDGEEAALAGRIAAVGDDADPRGLVELASYGTPEALSGLLGLLGRMESIYMRREVLRALSLLLDVESTREGALEALARAAGTEPSPRLREIAVEALAAQEDGRAALAELVTDLELRPEARLEVLEGFAERVSKRDVRFLEEVFGPNGARRYEPPLRAAAFAAAVPWLTSAKLAQAGKHELSGIRLAALEGLRSRADKRLAATALKMHENRAAPEEERLAAARIWLEVRGTRAGKRLLEDALGENVPEALAFGVADAVAARHDEALERVVRQRLRSASPRAKRVLLRAARAIDGPELDEAFEAALAAPDPRLVREAANGIGARGQAGAAAALRRLVSDDGDGWLAAVAVEALADLAELDDADLDKLVRDRRSPVRCSALRALAKRGGTVAERAAVAALGHADWSTRLAALEGLLTLRSAEGVGALCRRIGREEGRLLNEMADVLWQLTGELHGANARAWQSWWEKAGDGFEVLSAEEFARREGEREEFTLRHTSRATFMGRDGSARFVADLDPDAEEFFGFRVVSHRIVFVIDVSDTMRKPLGTDSEEEARTRLQLAQRELRGILARLDPRAHFRLITFCGAIETWADELRPASPENVAEAREFVDGIRSWYGTNFYDALRLAFADPHIDTIYLLSDGEPDGGDVQDPSALRAIVREWNRYRGIEVHCVAVGTDLGLLRGMAKDSGGAYAFFR